MRMQLDDLLLPPGLIWTDEFASQTVVQSIRQTLDGAVVVYYAARSGGLPITLESASDAGWLTRLQVEALRSLADQPGRVMSLQLRGTIYPVMFRHHEAPAFAAQPLVPVANPGHGDYYLATLKLMTL